MSQSVKDKKYIEKVEEKFLRKDLPELEPGQIVRVWYRTEEKEKKKLSSYQGVVISVRGSGISKTFTIRNVLSGIGVEWIIPYNSPHIEKIEILGETKVRRAKLYYLRNVKVSELPK